MTHSKTRLRVARIAAGAVFAAGASLTAVGTASALDLSVGVMGGEDIGGTASIGEVTSGVNEGGSEGSEGGSEGTEGGDQGGSEGGDQGASGGDQGGSEGGDQGASGGNQGGSEGGDQGASGGNQGGSEGGDQGTSGGNQGASGGNQGGSGSGGPQPATTGGTGGPEDPQTCVLDESTVDCGNNTDTDAVGTRPISQAKPKEELAETGAAETTLLLVGAATMIAGGVGFRLMPRLAGRRTVA
ncbi:MAG TPA: collagen-like protein [Streptomyces sp.]|nr:collagen-like protein [Streptomyces sp.]